MPKSDASWSGRLRQITDLERPDHHLLRPEDQCAYLGDYTARAGYAHSATNQLITNLKKKPIHRGTPQWAHKVRAIGEAAQALAGGLIPGALASLTLVPIPPSKMAHDAEFDDRMFQVARKMGPAPDVRRLIYLAEPREAAHERDQARDPQLLMGKLRLDLDLIEPRPAMIALVDDVLTTGCSFRACRLLLDELLPDVPIVGLFVARRKIDQCAAFDFQDLDF